MFRSFFKRFRKMKSGDFKHHHETVRNDKRITNKSIRRKLNRLESEE